MSFTPPDDEYGTYGCLGLVIVFVGLLIYEAVVSFSVKGLLTILGVILFFVSFVCAVFGIGWLVYRIPHAIRKLAGKE